MTRVAALGAVVLVVAWSLSAVLMSTRGFDITDEGYYLLSYRDWNSNLRTFTGSQYIYGPLFDLVGQSVPALRIVRLLSVLTAHAAFAWAFMSWLHAQPQGLHLPLIWRWAGGLAILASGGVVYGWLPLSPGYNDVSVLGALALMAAVLRLALAFQTSRRVPLLPLIVMGPVVVMILLAKSVAGLPSITFVLGITVALALQSRPRGSLIGGAVFVGSVALTLVLVNQFVMPFTRMLPPIRTVNALVAVETNSPFRLLELYVRSTGHLLEQVGRVLVVPVVLVLLGWATMFAGRRRAALALLTLAAPFGLALRWPERGGLPPAGAQAILQYTTALTSMAILVLAVLAGGSMRTRTGAERRPRHGPGLDRVIVVVAVALLPAVQALGTGNELYVMAVNQMACWVALMVMAAASVRGRRALAVPIVSALSAAVVVAAGTGVGGLLEHPYRTDAFTTAQRPIGGDGLMAGLKVSSQRADDYRRLLAVASSTGGQDRVVLAFDEMPGLVLLLDGRAAGEAWYPRTDQVRTAAGIRSSCGVLRDGSLSPALALFDRQPSAIDRAALRDCGLVLTDEPVTVQLVGRPDVLLFTTARA